MFDPTQLNDTEKRLFLSLFIVGMAWLHDQLPWLFK